ncbi:MAG TPA: hypothetical protein VFE58_10335 [Tepidisphaeraceae bacterium]|jgi:hypothetical protein|nr:hypothetical protein [Tepidisphaeraceae bacterium]
MSSASIGGTGSSLYQFLQSISQQQQQQAASSTSSTSSTLATSAASAIGATTGTTSSSAIQGAGGHHGHHGGGGGMFKKLESAVTDALQSAQSDGSTDDPNQTIEDAITKVLNGSTSSTSSSTDPSATTDPTTTSTSSTDDAASRQDFFNTLQQYGIDPQQFKSDLMSAMQQAKNGGQADPSAAFKSFPPGVAVDVAA